MRIRAGWMTMRSSIIPRGWVNIAVTATRAITRAWNTRTRSKRWLAAAQTFAANGISADQIYVNVQALSGAPFILSLYGALLGKVSFLYPAS